MAYIFSGFFSPLVLSSFPFCMRIVISTRTIPKKGDLKSLSVFLNFSGSFSQHGIMFFAGKLGKRMIMLYAKIETCLQALIIPVFLPKNKKLLK